MLYVLVSVLTMSIIHLYELQITGQALEQLFRSQPAALFPHLNAIQDWLRFVAFFSCFTTASSIYRYGISHTLSC